MPRFGYDHLHVVEPLHIDCLTHLYLSVNRQGQISFSLTNGRL